MIRSARSDHAPFNQSASWAWRDPQDGQKPRLANARKIMPLPKEFWEALPLKSDTELYEMLAHEDDYRPEALDAARAELARRKLAPERVAQLEAVTGARTAENLRKAEEPLSWPLRIMVFLVCAGLPGMFMALYYDSKGARRKSRECWITAVLGLGASVLAGAFLAAISH